MKLKPCATLSMIYSLETNCKIKKPKLETTNSCVYNNTGRVAFVFGGSANIEIIRKDNK